MTLVVLSILAQFGIPGAGNPWWPSVQAPPNQYNHAYHGHLVIKEINTAAMRAKCGYGVQGCTLGARHGSCIVYIDGMYHNTVRQGLLRHEIAHCNGWRH